MRFKVAFCALLCLITFAVSSQITPSYKFEKITAADFAPTVYAIDSSADAIILADVGSTEFEGNSKGGFSLVFKRHLRARILKNPGFPFANQSITIYQRGDDEEDLKSLKAVTYNLENGKVNDSKLDKSSIYEDKINAQIRVKRFTFPKVKEGSIIDLEYKIVSDFTDNLRAWEFQHQYPVLWSEYVVGIPEFYAYTTLTQGYQPFFVNERKDRLENFTVEETRVNAGITAVTSAGAGGRTSFDATVSDYRWVMKDIPALKEEGFTSTINNHIAKISFQISSIKTRVEQRDYLKSWPDAIDELLRSPDFAYTVNNRDNSWMTEEMNVATKGATDELQKAKGIFYYIRDNVSSTGRPGIALSKPLRLVLKDRSGTGADINLLLTAMCLKAGLTAEPVILSTRANGFIHKDMPILSQFNHVVAQVTANGKKYYLDASTPKLGFGKLSADSYNGQARVVNAAATAVDFSTEQITETKVTQVDIKKDGKGGLQGTITHMPGYFESLNARRQIAKDGQDKFFKDLNALSTGITLFNASIDSLNNFESPLTIHLNVSLVPEGAQNIYFNPMIIEGWRDNLFRSPNRHYPVELPYKIDQFYQLKMEVPDGYVVEEMPQQAKIKINNEEDGIFEYLISESNGVITFTSRLRVKRTVFGPAEYHALRDFFSMVVKKHSETIVFKKK